MKTLFSILIVLCSFGVSAQQEVQVRNNTTMDLDFVFYIYDATCTQYDFYTVTVPANSPHTTPLLPAGEEYVWVEISTPCGASGLNVGTPVQCNSICSPPAGVPFYQSTTSCSGNYTFYNARWTDCGAPGFGYLEVNEYL
jgi:hypothetical protein